MRHYTDIVFNTGGLPQSGVSVTIKVAGTATLAPLFSDDGVTSTGNPVSTDALGRFSFYVADGRYDLVFSGTGISPLTLTDIEIADSIERNTGDSTFNIGSLLVKNLNSIRVADQFVGGDVGAKIAAADADLGATAGEIWVSQLAGTTWTSAVTLSANHVLRFIQGGTVTVSGSGKLTMNFVGNSLIGPGSGALTFDCSALSGDFIRWQMNPFTATHAGTIQGVTFKGGASSNCNLVHAGDVTNPKFVDIVFTSATGTSSNGLWLENATNFTERTLLLNVHFDGNTNGIKLSKSGTGTNSFARMDALGVYFNIAASQTGISSLNDAFIYGGDMSLHANITGAGATLLSVGGTSNWQGNTIHLEAESTNTATGISVAAGASFRNFGERNYLTGNITDVNSNGATSTATLRWLGSDPLNSQDGGSIANFLGSGAAVTVFPAILDSSTGTPTAAFGLLEGTNIASPYVAMFDFGARNAFEIYKWGFGAAPNAMVEVARIDQAGRFTGAGTTSTSANPAQSGLHRLSSTDSVAWRNNANNGDILLSKDSGDNLSFTGNNIIQQSANGGQWVKGQASELLTLSTGGTTTDTSANLLPANSIIEAVVARVTTTIVTATDWKLGDAIQAARFSNANSTLVSGTATVGLNHADPTVATANLGPVQSAAAKVRVTTTGTPSAGAIRITVFYRSFVAPTS